MSEADPTSKRPSHAAPPLVFAAVALGGLGIGFGIAATILMVKSRQAAPAASSSVHQVVPLSTTPREPARGPWLEELHASSCAAPCCGGAACAVSSENAGKSSCKEGSQSCDRCASGISCIPGSCGAQLGAGEELGLHLSAVAEKGPAGEVLDACKTQRDLWLCLRLQDERDWQCLSQREACSNQTRSPAGVRLQSDDLLRHGFDVEVREGAPDGTVLAQKSRAVYRGGISRRTFCGGMLMSIDSPKVGSFTFYLDAPPEADAPSPVRVAPRAEQDAGAPGPAATPSAAATSEPPRTPAPPASVASPPAP